MTPRVQLYVRDAAQNLGVDAGAVLGPSRRRKLCQARWQVMKRLRADGFSLTQIGRWLNRDHTTVINGLRSL